MVATIFGDRVLQEFLEWSRYFIFQDSKGAEGVTQKGK
jgi:hypothetical protein